MNDPSSERDSQADGGRPAVIVGGAPESHSRRRLIRAGTAAVPVIATLASRPVLGATCNTTSAWGSAQLNMAASATARNARSAVTIDAWTINQWKTGDRASAPWQKLGQDPQNYKVEELYGPTIPSGVGFAGNKMVQQHILQGSSTEFQKAIVVAALNMKVAASTNVASCLTPDQLTAMSNGSFTPVTGGMPWTQEETVRYLSNNGIASNGFL